MDITWQEFQLIAPQLDEVTQLRIMNAVLVLRVKKAQDEVQDTQDLLASKDNTIARLEEDARSSNGAR